MQPNRTCLNCGESIFGRSDKKFCDDACRNNYNNSQRRDVTNLMRNVNNALRKNRLILEKLVPSDTGKTKVHKDKLLKQGFDFDMLTSIYTTRNGNQYRFVYEYGYLELDESWLALVRRD